MAIDYSELIPNNVNLADNRRLQRALEEWQPKFLDWWKELGPEGYQAADVYLRTATSVDAQGWAQFGRVRMPDYRWGIFLAERDPDRVIAYGDNKGKPVWQDVPGELRTWAAPAGSPGDYLPEWLSNTLDFAVVFGGDGTVLWTCHMFGNRSVPPLVPFNLGSLGFLTPFAPAALPRVLGRVVRGARGGARKAC